jgi:hypothetical protein
VLSQRRRSIRNKEDKTKYQKKRNMGKRKEKGKRKMETRKTEKRLKK